MSETESRATAEVERLLAGATEAVADIRNCWLATAAGGDGAHARPVERLKREPGDDAWTIRFLTDGRSRKAAEIRRDGRVTLIFQRDADDAFVAVTGTARLYPEAPEGGRRWRRAYDPFFPTGKDRACAAFVEIAAERLELWIRGVTPEPIGLGATVLERDGTGWRLVGAGQGAASKAI